MIDSTGSRTPRSEAGRVRAHRAVHGPRAEPHRARDFLGDVVRALQLQELARAPEDAADRGSAGAAGARRECRRGRHRRRPGGGVQDRIPQSPVVHRAVPGRGDRRRRHHPRYFHHGRAADRAAELAPLRRAGRSGHAPAPRRRGRRHCRLRQQHRHPHGRRRDRVRAVVRGQSARQRVLPRHRQGVGHHQGRRLGRRQLGLLRRREDRPRRHPRRHDGVRRVRREVGGEAPGGAGRRSVHGEAAARGVPRGDADRRARRHPGHGRGRPDLLDDRDGIAWRRRRRNRRRPRPAARNRHDAVRDHAVGVAGAHAARREAGPGSRSRAHLREMGPPRRPHRPGDRATGCCASRSEAPSSPRFRTAR